MDQTPPLSTDAQDPQRSANVRNLTIAILFGVPAVLFWALLGVVGIGLMTVAGNEEVCNVARVQLHGVLTTTSDGISQLLGVGVLTSADAVINQLAAADADETIDAVVLDVDSPGGTPVAGDELMQAIAGLTKPVVAVVRDLGTSAAYWAMAGADYIIASPVSDVGSIGVTMSYVELAGANEEEGSRWVGISSGVFKDAGNPDRHLTETEQDYFQKQVDTVHDYMVDRIASVRTTLSRERLATLADGRAFLGTEALTLGLIDAVGGFQEATTYLDTLVNRESGSSVLCRPAGGGLEDIFN